MAALGLDKGGPVQSDGSYVVAKEHYPMASMMVHDQLYLHPHNRNYIMRYLVKPPIGYALLLGSSRYKEPLQCVERDLKAMGEVLSEGGWEINVPCGCYTEKDSYEKEVQMLQEKDLKKYSCFMFYFSGHGCPEGMLLEPNCELIPFKDVVDMVLHLNDLRGKPKILIFDCCRVNTACEGKSFGGSNPTFMSLGEKFADTYRDMIVCFACSNNAPSYSAHTDGSIFTQHFAISLRELGRKISFVELLDQAKGGTLHVADLMYDMKQQPVSYSGLNAQLLLKETLLSDSDREKVERMSFPMVVVPLDPLDRQPEVKGRVDVKSSQPAPVPPSSHQPLSPLAMPSSQTPSDSPMVTSPHHEPVMRDYVSTVARFTTKRDVVANVRTLGQGHHVFLCYLPDPASPYGHPDPTRVQSNLKRMTNLHYDLYLHGFVVTSDLSLGDQQPQNVLEWYVRHIEHCNHVILVCSPAFKELFTSSRPQRPVMDPKAQRFLCYSSAIYAECERNVSREGRGMSKFIPVLLDPEWMDSDRSVPLLFRGSHIYQLFEEHPRQFDYDNTERHFERLVCRMVGINRATIDAPQPGTPIPFSSSSSIEETNRRKFLAQAYMPRDNYFTRPFRVDQPASEQSSREQAWAKVNPTEWRHTASTEPSHYTSSTYQMSPPAQPIVSDPTPSLTAGLPSTGDCPPHDRRQYVATQYPAPSSVPPSHDTSTATAATTTTESDPNTLPLTPPPRGLLLWLSGEVVYWKFLGRYLDVEESTIERIALENPNNIREQCFQMLKTFEVQQGEKCTCRQLGKALLESGKNRHLFVKFCAKLQELSNE